MPEPQEFYVSSLQPFQKRVVTEKAELDEKLEALRKFIKTAQFCSLLNSEQSRLQRQVVAMSAYSTILGERIAAF